MLVLTIHTSTNTVILTTFIVELNQINKVVKKDRSYLGKEYPNKNSFLIICIIAFEANRVYSSTWL